MPALAQPDYPCGHIMRDGDRCNMEHGHRGRCTTVAWECDGCGRTRRSQPAASHPEAGTFCFMCVLAERGVGPGGWWH